MKNTVQGGWKKPGNSASGSLPKPYTGSVKSASRATSISAQGNAPSPRGTISSSKLNPNKALGK